MKRYCLALDLKADAELITEYENMHRQVWSEVLQSIKSSGIQHMEIYRVNNRLVMIIEATDSFSFDAKAAADLADPKVVEWEQLMWKYQQPMPFAKRGEKWILMNKIFDFS